jgi:hypothetical protein
MIFLNIHAKTHFLLPNAYVIKQDVERAFGNKERPTLFLSN